MRLSLSARIMHSMNVDNKMPLLKNFTNETKLSQSGFKAPLDHSAVTSTEKKNVSLETREKNLNFCKDKSKNKSNGQDKDKNKNHQNAELQEQSKTAEEIKILNLSKITKFII